MPPRRKPSRPTSKKTAKGGGPSDPVIVNLEMKGDHLKVFTLQTLLTNKRSKETRDTAKLGDVLLPWFEKMVSRPSEKIEGILDLWLTHIPNNLRERARLTGFSRGTLTVAVESSTTRAELDAVLRSGMLKKLQTESRGTIYRIKTCVQTLADS